MKIVQIINSLSAGGAETFVVDLSITMAKQGHSVLVFCYAGTLDKKGIQLRQRLELSGVQFIGLDCKSILCKLVAPVKLYWVIRNFKPHVAHSHLEQSDFVSMISTFFVFRNRPICVRTIHNVYATKKLAVKIHKRMMFYFDLSVACGDLVKKSYPYLLKNKATKINNGIRLSAARPTGNFKTVRSRLGVSNNNLMVINIGSFTKRNGILQKSQDIIIEALATIDSSNVRMFFIGDGEQKGEIELAAKQRELENSVFFTGLIDNVDEILGAADLVLMPSRFEGLSIACIEAVCSGKPLIVSDIPSFNIFSGKAVRYVTVENIDLLVKTFNEMATNIEYFKYLANEEVDRYRRMFDMNNVAEKYVAEYNTLLEKL